MTARRWEIEPSLAWPVCEGGEVASAIRCRYHLDNGWVDTVAARPWHGRGLGRALLLQSFGETTSCRSA